LIFTDWDLRGEIWFDGGYSAELKSSLTELLAKFQPNSNAFNGFGISKNPLRWIGTEAGQAPDPTWSTGVTNDGGDPNSPFWCPAECDTTLQNRDRWFYNATIGIRSLDELIGVYHQTVGHNCMLMIDFTPDRTGLIPPSYAARYKELGDWIRSCYTIPVEDKSTNGYGKQFLIKYTGSPALDRVVIQEDQAIGQRVRSYHVEVLNQNQWQVISNGTSVGNKKIDLLQQAVQGSQLRLTILTAVGTPRIRFFAGYLC